MKFATLGALARLRHRCEPNQPQASAADLAHACAGAPDAPARPFLALRAATCTPVISARGGGGSESHQSHKRLACTRSAAPNHELQAPLQPRAGRWDGGCAEVPAARRRWGSSAHPRRWSGPIFRRVAAGSDGVRPACQPAPGDGLTCARGVRRQLRERLLLGLILRAHLLHPRVGGGDRRGQGARQPRGCRLRPRSPLSSEPQSDSRLALSPADNPCIPRAGARARAYRGALLATPRKHATQPASAGPAVAQLPPRTGWTPVGRSGSIERPRKQPSLPRANHRCLNAFWKARVSSCATRWPCNVRDALG